MTILPNIGKFNLLDLCSGAGGFHLAAELAGFDFDQTFHADINEYANKIYQARFPASQSLGDLRNIRRRSDLDDRTIPGSRWVVTAGFPCQPFSVAGSGKGVDDDRYLWDEILRIAAEFRPDFFIFENVTGIESVPFAQSETRLEVRCGQRPQGLNYQQELFEQIQDLQLGKCLDDLENAGAAFQTFDIPALGVNAWHRRRRIWIVGSFADTVSGSGEIRQAADARQSAGFTGRDYQFTSANHSDINDERQFGRFESGENGQRQIRARRGNDQPFGEPAIRESRIAGNNADITGDQIQKPERQNRQSLKRGFGQSGLDGQRNSADDHCQKLTQTRLHVSESQRSRKRSGDWRGNWSKHWVEAATELCRSDDGLREELDIARLRNDIAGRYPNATEADIERAISKLETGYRKSRIELMGNSIVPQIPTIFFEIFKQICNAVPRKTAQALCRAILEN